MHISDQPPVVLIHNIYTVRKKTKYIKCVLLAIIVASIRVNTLPCSIELCVAVYEFRILHFYFVCLNNVVCICDVL